MAVTNWLRQRGPPTIGPIESRGHDTGSHGSLPRAERSRRKVGLERPTLIDTALRIIDEDGLEALTIRSLARRLGVWPNTVYWHVENWDNLISAVITLATESTTLNRTDTGEDWRTALADFAHGYRDAVRRHPNIAPALTTRSSINSSHRFPMVERLLAVLRRAGFEDAALVGAYNAFFGAVAGYVVMELTGSGSKNEGEQWKTELEKDLRSLPPEQYPTLAHNRDVLANRIFSVRWTSGSEQALDSGFETLLSTLISGFKTQLDGTA